MSSCFCCTRGGLPQRSIRQLQTKLKEVNEIYPGTVTSFIIEARSGKLIIQSASNNSEQTRENEQLINVILGLKKASIEFGETLKEKSCRIIHIKGETHLFSCYDINSNNISQNEYYLVFYTEMKNKYLNQFEITNADEKIDKVCQDLGRMLDQTAN